MILIIEIILLLAGGYALITGKLPDFLFRQKYHRNPPWSVRVMGALLMVPIPLAVGLALVIGAVDYAMGLPPSDWINFLDIPIIVVVFLATVIVQRLTRQEVRPLDANGNPLQRDRFITEELIAKKVNGSLFYVIFTMLGFAFFITGPLVILRTSQAIKMIEQTGIGEQYLKNARSLRTIAIILVGTYSVLVVGFILYVVVASLTLS